MSRFAYQKNSAFVGLLLALFLIASLAITFHVVLAGHDAELCSICTWYQIQGWTISGYILLLYLTSQPIAIQFQPRFTSVFHLPATGRSPPLF